MERWPRLSGGQQYERDAELVGEPGAHAQSLDRHSHNWDKVQSRRHRSTDHLESGSRTLVDEVRSGSSYDSNNDMRVHFGLGGTTRIDFVQIRWPSGLVERFDNPKIDSIQTMKEGTGTPLNAAKTAAQ